MYLRKKSKYAYLLLLIEKKERTEKKTQKQREKRAEKSNGGEIKLRMFLFINLDALMFWITH